MNQGQWEAGEAGSYAGSEQLEEDLREHEQEESQQEGGAADSVNNGPHSPVCQARASILLSVMSLLHFCSSQSTLSQRVPRSQISRAHPGQAQNMAERTSAVLSVLSGDDETALSAAEIAGEHTSQPVNDQSMPPAVPPLNGVSAAQQAASKTAHDAPEPAGSPPTSTSPIVRASSIVSQNGKAVVRIHQTDPPAIVRLASSPHPAAKVDLPMGLSNHHHNRRTASFILSKQQQPKATGSNTNSQAGPNQTPQMAQITVPLLHGVSATQLAALLQANQGSTTSHDNNRGKNQDLRPPPSKFRNQTGETAQQASVAPLEDILVRGDRRPMDGEPALVQQHSAANNDNLDRMSLQVARESAELMIGVGTADSGKRPANRSQQQGNASADAAEAMELAAEDDAVEVQQRGAGTREAKRLRNTGSTPRHQQVASVLATVIAPNGESDEYEDDPDVKQTASGPTNATPSKKIKSASNVSNAEPAVAQEGPTSMNTGAPSQQGPQNSIPAGDDAGGGGGGGGDAGGGHGGGGGARSSLATLSLGAPDPAGGSVDMELPKPPYYDEKTEDDNQHHHHQVGNSPKEQNHDAFSGHTAGDMIAVVQNSNAPEKLPVPAHSVVTTAAVGNTEPNGASGLAPAGDEDDNAEALSPLLAARAAAQAAAANAAPTTGTVLGRPGDRGRGRGRGDLPAPKRRQ